jgi:hypothetical protein
MRCPAVLLVSLGASASIAATSSLNLIAPIAFVETHSGETGTWEFVVNSSGFHARFDAHGERISLGMAGFTVSFPGASRTVRLEGLDLQPGIVNFLMGSAPANWRMNCKSYGQIAYRDLYPGIDLVSQIKDGHLKSDFIVGVGTDPRQIRLAFSGMETTAIDAKGNLVVATAAGVVVYEAPVVFQLQHGERRLVTGAYRRSGPNTFGFLLGRYDHGKPLIIDPVLSYSTFFGGSGADAVTSVAVDNAGNMYLTGWTESSDFPMASPAFGPGGGVDAFAAKLDPTGSRLIYCTYLGGTGDDRGTSIVVDANGDAYITGSTASPNFPAVNAVQPALKGSTNGFIVKLNSSGAPIFSTYFGGSGSDTINAITLGPSGGIYVAGCSTSTDLPVSHAFQSTNHGQQDVFVTEVSASGNGFIYSTYLGGAGDDCANGIAVDSSGNAYVAGSTSSANFPALNALQPTLNGQQDAFVFELNSTGQALLYSTYLGGSGGSVGFPEAAASIAVDSSGDAYVAGMTPSMDFPVTNALQASNAGGIDAFIVQLGPAGNQMLYGTYLGGVNNDFATAIAVDGLQNAYVAGYTASSDFPTLVPVQSTNAGLYDAFVAKVNAAGVLVYSTYLGGVGSDAAKAITILPPGQVYVAGQTLSYNYPTLNPFQAVNGGNYGGFLTRLTESCAASVQPSSAFVGVGPNAGSVMVSVSSACAWNATSNAAWLTVTNGSVGGGDGVVSYSVVANGGSAPRTGTLTIAGQAFTLTQGGATAKVGVFRQGFYWILDVDGNDRIDSPPDQLFPFGGVPGDIPITGDWNGDGSTKVGLYRPKHGLFILDYNGNGSTTGNYTVYNFGIGIVAGDLPRCGRLDWRWPFQDRHLPPGLSLDTGLQRGWRVRTVRGWRNPVWRHSRRRSGGRRLERLRNEQNRSLPARLLLDPGLQRKRRDGRRGQAVPIRRHFRRCSAGGRLERRRKKQGRTVPPGLSLDTGCQRRLSDRCGRLDFRFRGLSRRQAGGG